MFKALQWEDWAGVGLGAWLLASPWLFGYSDQPAAMMNALVMGTILVTEEFLDVGVHEALEEWIDVVAGAWLVISPLALGFQASTAASFNAIAVGLLTVAFAVLAMTPLGETIARRWRGGHALPF